jgi:MerR family transcriptional regulator, thiopeptide resistance regulator
MGGPYRVRALRSPGLSLEEIASVLADSADSADDLAAMRGLLTAQRRQEPAAAREPHA